MAKFKILDTRVDGVHARTYDLRAENYFTQPLSCVIVILPRQ